MTLSMLTNSASDDINHLAWLFLRAPGKPSEAAFEAAQRFGETSRLARLAKAAVSSGTTDSPGWTSLAALRLATAEWSDSRLADISVLDAAARVSLQGAVGTRGIVSTQTITGFVSTQGAPKPISAGGFANVSVEPRRAATLIVLSAEILKVASPQAFFRLLENGTAFASDLEFIGSMLASGAPSVLSTGTDAGSVLNDLRAAAGLIAPTARSRLFAITDSRTLLNLALLESSDGGRAFEDIDHSGGLLAGITWMASDAIEPTTAGSKVVVFDATRTVIDRGAMSFDTSAAATLEMDSSPNSPPNAASVTTSLFQQDLRALRVERHFGFSFLQNAASIIEDVNYGVEA